MSTPTLFVIAPMYLYCFYSLVALRPRKSKYLGCVTQRDCWVYPGFYPYYSRLAILGLDEKLIWATELPSKVYTIIEASSYLDSWKKRITLM